MVGWSPNSLKTNHSARHQSSGEKSNRMERIAGMEMDQPTRYFRNQGAVLPRLANGFLGKEQVTYPVAFSPESWGK
jgi:hypothetical protein